MEIRDAKVGRLNRSRDRNRIVIGSFHGRTVIIFNSTFVATSNRCAATPSTFYHLMPCVDDSFLKSFILRRLY